MNIENYIEKDYNHVCNKLQDYMLNKDNIQRFALLQEEKQNLLKKEDKLQDKNTENNNVSKKDNNNNNNKNNNFFYPRDKDSLFWSFYIIKNGLLNYQMIQNKNIVYEKGVKIDYVEKLRKEKQVIKPYKFDSLMNLENNLATDYKIGIPTFLTLCVIENINVIIVRKKTFYELLLNDTNDIYVINLSENDKYGFKHIVKNGEDYETYKNTFFRINNMDKPIKTITYYKVSELVDMCEKLSIEIVNTTTKKNKSKKELYELIIQQL